MKIFDAAIKTEIIYIQHVRPNYARPVTGWLRVNYARRIQKKREFYDRFAVFFFPTQTRAKTPVMKHHINILFGGLLTRYTPFHSYKKNYDARNDLTDSAKKRLACINIRYKFLWYVFRNKFNHNK